MKSSINTESLKNFDSLYESYSSVLYGTILQFTSNKNDAVEILQITFKNYYDECYNQTKIFKNHYIALNRCLLQAIMKHLHVSPLEAKSVMLNSLRQNAPVY